MNTKTEPEINEPTTAAVDKPNNQCYFCGNPRHPRTKCPAKDAVCNYCGNKAPKHSKSKFVSSVFMHTPTLASITATVTPTLRKSACMVRINGCNLSALIDSGSTDSFIHLDVANKLALPISPFSTSVKMASTSDFE